MPDATIDSGEFRRVLGHYPTGVTLITSHDDDGPIGAVMGSFGSVSLDPPLVMFMPTRESTSWARIEATGSFCANVLRADQVDLCVSFFKKDPECWDRVGWRRSSLGSPVFDDALAWIDCTIENVVEAGDHLIVLGRVHHLDSTADEHAAPLLFFRGGYGRFED
jgi:flavin reductase (DIM6/NTAB) family NADH-FMN oxidoreductase RutF